MSNNSSICAKFTGRRLLVLGFGSIAATVLPMIIKHIGIDKNQILILSDDGRYSNLRVGIEHQSIRLTPENHTRILAKIVTAGDCIVNLTGGVSARDLVKYCLLNGIDYIDTSNERWEHGAMYNDSADFAQQWAQLIGDRDILPKASTALVSHGANPGIVSHFAKQAVENLARSEGYWSEGGTPDWPKLAMALEIEALHISEQDSQTAKIKAGSNDFFNTWSVEGLIEEGHSAPCFAWGTHEQNMHAVKLRKDPACMVASFPAPAKHCKTQSWIPSEGPFSASIIPHEEAFSIAELFSDWNNHYQPSVLFAYRPCPQAYVTLFSQNDGLEALKPRVLMKEVQSGVDELGILVLRKGKREVYWYGSTLDIDTARSLVPCANATSLQVAAGVLGGIVWILENANKGLVSAEDTDHTRVLEVARPYLGNLEGVSGIWEDSPSAWQMSNLLESEYI